MKERPIIFSGEMIKAILAGNKTQTRRVIKPQPLYHDSGFWNWDRHPYYFMGFNSLDELTGRMVERNPYGRPGDRLWCKETWRYTSDRTGFVSNPNLEYRADYNGVAHTGKWRSPLFMPRRASRLTLEITAVRAERLWDITEEDAKKEGIQVADGHMYAPPGSKEFRPYTHVEAFSALWDSINGKKYPWQSNPFVWILEFRRVQP